MQTQLNRMSQSFCENLGIHAQVILNIMNYDVKPQITRNKHLLASYNCKNMYSFMSAMC